MSNRLLQRAIMQSGVTLSPGWHFISQEDATNWGITHAQNLNCFSTSISEIIECLQSKSITEIASGDTKGRYRPTIESSFLPRTPIEILTSGDFNKEIEVIIGSNADEGLLIWADAIEDPSQFDSCRDNFEYCGPATLYYRQTSEVTDEDIENARL